MVRSMCRLPETMLCGECPAMYKDIPLLHSAIGQRLQSCQVKHIIWGRLSFDQWDDVIEFVSPWLGS